MKKVAQTPDQTSSAKDQKTDSKSSPAKKGPVTLDAAQLKQVSGGVPRGGWQANVTDKS